MTDAERIKQGLRDCEAALVQEPDNFNVLCYYGRCLYYDAQHQRAEQVLSRCLEREERYFFLWSMRGDCRLKLGRHAEALDDYQRSIGVDPGNAAVWDSAAQAFLLLGDQRNAFAHIDHAIALDPASDLLMIRKAQMLHAAGRETDAIAQAGLTLERFPKCTKALALLTEFKNTGAE